MNKKLINVVKGDINTALENGNYNRNTTYQTNIEFNTPTKLILLDGIPYSSPLLTKVTWQELKNKRDAGKLIPGSLYRITDYQCTTTEENTRSAGHQFDIVLLALNKDKLAEEGWAMMHDNIYDVTFSDGVTKKCYIYVFDDGGDIYLVDVDTLLGFEGNINVFEIDEDNKTAQTSQLGSDVLTDENLPYNYFQNSNLSAWKIWYCLDNDTSRFAWADDSVDEGEPAFITTIGGKGEIHTWYRYSAGDSNNLFAWNEDGGSPRYTASQTPSAGDTMYYDDGTDSGLTVNSFTPAHEGTGPNGRGVIYRMIDEWNNDCPYDFKSLMFAEKLNPEDGQIDREAETDYYYTFSVREDNVIKDASILTNHNYSYRGYFCNICILASSLYEHPIIYAPEIGYFNGIIQNVTFQGCVIRATPLSILNDFHYISCIGDLLRVDLDPASYVCNNKAITPSVVSATNEKGPAFWGI